MVGFSMNGLQFYGTSTASRSGTPRTAAPSTAPDARTRPQFGGAQMEILLSPSTSRHGQNVQRPALYVEDSYDEETPEEAPDHGHISSGVYPRAKRKAEMSACGLSPAMLTAVKQAVAAASAVGSSLGAQKKRGRPKGWKPGMPYSETTRRPVSAAAKLIYAQRLRDDPDYKRAGRSSSDRPSDRLAGRPSGRPPGRAPSPGRPNGRPSGRPIGKPPGSGSGPAMKGPPKPRGRPPKKPPPTPREIYRSLTPRFEPFRCEWTGCKAELHNMATLRAHVHKIHGRDEQCKWASCVEEPAVAPEGGGAAAAGPGRSGHVSGAPSFLTGDEFAEHVETAHLVPIEWRRGDGYRNSGPISKEKTTTTASYEKDADPPPAPRYLFDKDGNQVTPWVWYQELEDNATRLANQKKLRAALWLMNEEAPSEEEEEEDGAADGG